MYRSYPNVLPVANRYLGHKIFLKEQADHQSHVKNARSVLNLSESSEQFKFSPSTREHGLAMIKQENERLRMRMTKTESQVDTHNHYVLHSLNISKRQREKAQHETELERLKKQLGQVRTSYPVRQYRQDFAKNKDLQNRLTRYPLKVK
ncbi:unnamed protein product [Rotaria socialis]|uniref:Uncharacterized protein n=1 Tax=Rotaria socialis TaxID=392032 RepID=A0A818EYF3_9BILA|nr:unnamed protein product [Rotaria socialis]CAF3376547.1 unnamed protein product [Rotaria socialis]CAF3467259.1 unnamed protein product [Rotaria socialis]CAF3639783.1 unnamed protein product [Rotaria socialis]CAF3706476.1 unnamed protein product [Rotaria socialis]